MAWASGTTFAGVGPRLGSLGLRKSTPYAAVDAIQAGSFQKIDPQTESEVEVTPEQIPFGLNFPGILKQVALILLTLGSANPIAHAQVHVSPPATSVYMVTIEDNASQGFTPDVTDIDRETVLEQYTFAIVVPPAYGVASVMTTTEAGQVYLAWDKVDAPSLAGYSVYYVLSAFPVDHESSCVDELGNADIVDVSATETTVSVSDLVPGETYCFGVKAYDDAEQESVFSNTLRYQLPRVGQLVYTPEPDFKGIDRFSYQATDRQAVPVTPSLPQFLKQCLCIL